MDSYNLFLYRKRQELGLTPRAFARKLNISHFRYHLIENGYVKPGKKDVKNISSVLDVDYAPYLEGELSYPGEKPDVRKKFLKVFDVIGSKAFKITMLSLCALFIVLLIVSQIIYGNLTNNKKSLYSDNYKAFYNALVENGKITISLTGSIQRPAIMEITDDKYVYIKGEYDENSLGSAEFGTVYWTDDYRCIIDVNSMGSGSITYFVQVYDYATNKDYAFVYSEETGLVEDGTLTGIAKKYESDIKKYADEFLPDHDALIKDKLSLDITAISLLDEINQKSHNEELNITLSELGFLASLIFALVTLFGFIYAVVYGTKNGVEREFSHGLIVYNAGSKKPKKDIRFFPFIPETVYEIIGIILVAIASLRFQLYLVLAFYPTGAGMGVGDIKSMYQYFMLFFYAGMFLLYFIDFDLYLDDKRVIRNIAAYGFIFVVVYFLELFLLRSINEESLLFTVIEQRLPNMFGTITMYFVIMYLLYFTPKFINTKKKKIVFRSLSIIPVLVIFGTYLIFNGANTTFDWNLPDWALYLFASERVPFSLLCVSYLYGLYFLRLFFKKKYGDEMAANYFNGNRFLFLKNTLICLIVLAISLFDYFVSRNGSAKAWGFGYTYYSVLLIPVLFFYHPHKGPRNRIVDYITLALYFLAFTGVLAFFLGGSVL